MKQFYYWQRRVREEVYNEITTKSLPATTFSELQIPSHNTVSSAGTGATVRINVNGRPSVPITSLHFVLNFL